MLNENSDEIHYQSIIVTEGTVYCKPAKDVSIVLGWRRFPSPGFYVR